MSNIITNEILSFIKERNLNLKHANHLRNTNIFESTLTENGGDNQERTDILNLIKNNQYEVPDAQRFYDSLRQSKHSLMLTDYMPNELSKMKLFKLKNYNIGYALKPFNNSYEIVAVHNNEPDVKNIGNELLNSAIKNGGCYLDHFDGFLSNLYSGLGFIEYKRDKYNPEYDSGGEFQKRYGAQDVIYRVHKSCAK